MSLKRTAILLAVSQSNHNHSTSNTAWHSLASGGGASTQFNATEYYTATDNNRNYNQGLRVMRPGVGGFHGNVNILLGGAMLTVVTTIVCLICYCCHRKIKMQSTASSLYRQQRWLESDANMEIYSVEQYFDTSGIYTETDNLPTITTHNEPPPSYDCVMALDEVISRKRKNLYTFKAYHHHPGHVIKDCLMNGEGNATPQVSLDETHCDIRSPLSAASLCSCNCVMNQSFTAFATNLCANCNNVIDNADSANNNDVAACPVATISSNLSLDNCPLSDTNRGELDLLNNNNNNNNDDVNGNSHHQLDSIASPSTSTSTSTHYNSCSMPPIAEQLTESLNETEDDDDDEEIDSNGNCRQAGSVNLSTINRNGLIRIDMSEIIDQTGLPTYEAALHLKSSDYV